MPSVKAKAGKKNRKHKRSLRRASKTAYNSSQRWISNKQKKLVRHLKKHPKDEQAKTTDAKNYKSTKVFTSIYHPLFDVKVLTKL